MLLPKLLTALLALLYVYSACCKHYPFEHKIGGITYGSNALSCYKKCKRGQICTVKNGVTICKAYCGDGIVVGTELLAGNCDDGNYISGDGCSDCMVQPLWQCKILHQYIPSVCSHKCGNGIFQPQFGQQCDDANKRNGDGCTANCLIVPSYQCKLLSGHPNVSTCSYEYRQCCYGRLFTN